MKTIYIIPLLFLSTIIYAQENKQAAPIEDQAQVVKQLKEHETKLMQEAKENADKQTTNTGFPSDKGLEVKKQEQKSKAANENSGKLLPNTATLEEIKEQFPTDRHPEARLILRTQILMLRGCPILQRWKK